MKLSAPLSVLKNKAKKIKNSKNIKMCEALDKVAQDEGFPSWSLLISNLDQLLPKSKHDILEYLNPGDLMILSSPQGGGKTTFALKILTQAARERKHTCYFFSLESSHKDIASKLTQIDESIGQYHSNIDFDFSDEVSSDYIIHKTRKMTLNNSLILIDYMQILDQKRSKPDLNIQVLKLKQFAKETGARIIFISQMSRSFKKNTKRIPNIDDLNFPNPIDISLINKVLFLYNNKVFFVKPRFIELN